VGNREAPSRTAPRGRRTHGASHAENSSSGSVRHANDMGNTCGGGGGASAVGDGDLQLEREALRLRDGDRWYLADLPAGPVVRREIRRMSPAEQERFANAVDKMMEAEDGVPGTSQFFRLAGRRTPCSTLRASTASTATRPFRAGTAPTCSSLRARSDAPTWRSAATA
jgi:hypothetical protein